MMTNHVTAAAICLGSRLGIVECVSACLPRQFRNAETSLLFRAETESS